jgi:acylglycerol lipase
MLHDEGLLAGNDGVQLYQQHWLPEQGGEAIVVVVPGLAEHSGRYVSFADALAGRGYGVYAMDLRGHGRSSGERCFIRSFDEYLEDLDLFFAFVASREAEKPRFLLGHSMGGLIVAMWAITRQPQLRGLVLSGSLLQVAGGIYPRLRRALVPLGRLLPRLRLVRIDFSNVSRDPQVSAQFLADPLVYHKRFPLRTCAEMLRAVRCVAHNRHSLRLPLLVLHGGDDCLCDAGGARDVYRDAASTDKTLHVYEGVYHDVLRDPQSPQVTADLLAWLDQRR